MQRLDNQDAGGFLPGVQKSGRFGCFQRGEAEPPGYGDHRARTFFITKGGYLAGALLLKGTKHPKQDPRVDFAVAG